MLTNQDLQKIGDLIDIKLNSGFSDFDKKMDEKFEQKLAPIRSDISKIKKNVKEVKKTLDETKKIQN